MWLIAGIPSAKQFDAAKHGTCQLLAACEKDVVPCGAMCVAAGAAAGGALVRGDEVKEGLLSLVGRDKARLEACFALEQVVFRAVLAGQ
jgi:hypothetical protein